MNSQQRVAEMRERLRGRYPHPDSMDSWTYLVTEVAEVGDVLLRLKNPSDKRSNQVTFPLQDQLAKELGDVQVMLCTLASHHGVDLETECEGLCILREIRYEL